MGFLAWFCGKKETATSAQFAKMMKDVERKREGDAEKPAKDQTK